MQWILGIFFAVMLGFLVHSLISTAVDIQKKAQPTVDSFFDAITAVAFRKRSQRKQHRSGPPTKN